MVREKLIFNSLKILISVGVLLFSVDRSNSNDITEINAFLQSQGARWVAKETPLSNIPLEELRRRCGGAIEEEEPPSLPVDQSFYTPLALPSSFDWTQNGGNYVTSVKTQWCGGCWAFASVAALESKILITFDTPNFDLHLSEHMVMSCSGKANTCESKGSASLALKFLKNTGTTLESCYPLAETDGPWACEKGCENRRDLTFRIKEWSSVVSGPSADILAIKNAIYTYGPVVALMNFCEDFAFYGGGVYKHIEGDCLTSHYVLVVGWSDEKGAFKCKNSWSEDWGESGFFWIDYEELYGRTGTEVYFGYKVYAIKDVQSSGPVDLAITSLTGPEVGKIGGKINVSATVSNKGYLNAPPSRLGFYLSTDSKITSDDTIFSYCSVPDLGTGEKFICDGEVPVPSVSPGKYYLGAIADDLDSIEEDDRNNNVRVAGKIGISGWPDLTGRWVSLERSCQKDKCKISGTLSVSNRGDDVALSSSVGFYLSDNGSYNEGDMLLKKVATGSLKAGNSKDIKFSYSFPSTLTLIGKYLIAVLDVDNRVAEKNKANNEIVYAVP